MVRKWTEQNAEIGSRVRAIRENLRFTQSEFAERTDLTTQFISDIERGITGLSSDTLIKICEGASVSADYILFGKEIPPSVAMIANRLNGLKADQLNAVDEMVTAALKLVPESKTKV